MAAAGHYYPRSTQSVDAPCWCESTMQTVPLAEIRDGLTRPCDSPDCKWQDMKARAAA